ncbi:response regulator [Sulfurimonas aquatica]|uniref:Response regulator n=1 Tax=Sulfurimonas aquatica TaxID=2672570 RepID=A0A975B0U0_9BACT|nr:response regulator [Sulfurimonas aquatica]QSZ42033.1 response regulator [Sulfurimonas aquatica]
MPNIKDLLKYTSHLSILYVEDDDTLREETVFLFEPFFKSIDTAVDGVDGLKKYNDNYYDLVLTDINMPNMNGIDMINNIKEINPEQKIMAISAHNESEILIELIKAGTNSFILKPIIQNEVINALYPVCRDAYTQVLNLELIDEITDKNSELEKQIKLLNSRNSIIDVKHKQVESLLKTSTQPKDIEVKQESASLSAYFAQDECEGEENVLFLQDHVHDILEYFEEIEQILSTIVMFSDETDVLKISEKLFKISTILLHYSPYLNSLSTAFSELATAMQEHKDDFLNLLRTDGDSLLVLFDAVYLDMDRYTKRFSVESLAMRNSHHIHEPTVLSIKQIVSLFVIDHFEDGEIEFF